MNKKLICIALVSLLALVTVTNTVSAFAVKNKNEVKDKIIELLNYLCQFQTILEDEYQNVFNIMTQQGYSSDHPALEALRSAITDVRNTRYDVIDILENMDNWTPSELLSELQILKLNVENRLENLENQYALVCLILMQPYYINNHPAIVALQFALDGFENTIIKIEQIIDLAIPSFFR
jgi:hypothetical protein